MKMTNEQYGEYVKKKSPPSPMLGNLFRAFLIGGIICCVGQSISDAGKALGLDSKTAGTAASISLIFLGAFLTGIGIYDDIAKFAGAGTLVPITGFANSVVSPALEFKSEGFVTGMAAKMFAIAGPVIVFGVSASVIYGLILILFGVS
ncbi:MAG TPA: stage V sporulation protein AC [Clostridiales bacterium]|nr:stage V sporulation protein AC [Clostridiales bacterium]